MDRQGFSLVELMIAMVILTIGVLGIAASAGRLSQVSGEVQLRALAVQAAEDRLSQVVLDPRYVQLDTLYIGSDSNLPGLAGFTRQTSLVRTVLPQAGGKNIDYKTITVMVVGPGLPDTIVRESVVGAP